jgi:hypothetical protein
MHVWLGKMAPHAPTPRRMGGDRRIDPAGADRGIEDVEESAVRPPETRDPGAGSGRPASDGRGEQQDGARRPKPPGLW